jgi:PAS domain S-box-containing protein
MRPQGSAPSHRKRTWIPALVLITLLLLTAIATFSAARLFRTRDRLQFTSGVQQVRDSIERRLRIYTDMLVVGSTLYGANREVTHDEFREYVRRLKVDERYPGIQGIGFSMRVLPGDPEKLIARMQAEGFPDFRIWPDPGGSEGHSIIYLEPLDARNQQAIGFDMSSEPVRKTAMERARDTAEPAASGKVTLVQETAGSQVQPGFLIYVPVYRGGGVPATVEERRKELAGFIYSPFRAGDLLRGIFPDEARIPVDFRVFDGRVPREEHLLYETPRAERTPRQPRFKVQYPLRIAGADWTLEITSGELLESTSGSVVVPFLALSGLLMSLLVFRLTAAQAAAYAALEKSTEALKASQADLAASEEKHRMVTDGAADSIISMDDRGLIRSVNPSTVQTFGYEPDELCGKPLKSLIPDFNTTQQLPLGPENAVLDIELAAVNKSGQFVPVEISLSRYLRGGTRFFTGVIRDITQRKHAEAVQGRQTKLATLRADVSTALARSGSPIPAMLRHCVDALARHLSAPFAGVWTTEGTAKQLDLRASAGPSASKEFPQGGSAAGWPLVKRIASERLPFLLNELPADPPAFGHWVRRENLASFAGCPLLVEGQFIGVLALFARQPLPSDTLDVLASVADLMAQGIERKRIERTLQESEDRLRIAVESAEAGTWELYPQTGKLVWSSRTKALFGLPPDSEQGYEEFLARIYPEDAAAVRGAIDAAIDPQGDGRYEVDFRSLWPDGNVRWISAKGRAFFEETAGVRRVVRFTGTVIDVTKRRHAEERARFLAEAGSILSESLNFETTLARLAQLAVPRVADWCAVDMVSGGDIERLEFVHSDPAKIQLAKALPRSHPLDAKTGSGIAKAIRTGKPELFATVPDPLVLSFSPDEEHAKLLRELGTRSAVVVPIKARGRVFGAVTFVFAQSKRTYTGEDLSLAEGLGQRAGLAVDNALLYRAAQQEIAERRRVEEQIHQLNQELEERVRRRTQALEESNQHLEAFTYTVAHDLRAPLRAMQGFSQALLEDYAGRLDATGRDYVVRVTNAAQRMDGLIQDLLAYSRLSRTQLQTETVDLESVVDRVLLTFTPEIRAKHAVVEVGRPLPPVCAHPSTLEQVLANLVSNALKFVNPGTTPRIRISAEERDGRVCTSVIDQGIGVDPQYHERIFGVFERLHGPETFPGTGIGLAIVRKGVERMGGRVGLESQPGKGSRFWFILQSPQHKAD